jgi:hypothetical protein
MPSGGWTNTAGYSYATELILNSTKYSPPIHNLDKRIVNVSFKDQTESVLFKEPVRTA